MSTLKSTRVCYVRVQQGQAKPTFALLLCFGLKVQLMSIEGHPFGAADAKTLRLFHVFSLA